MSELGELASGIFANEFDSETGTISYSSISGWLEGNLGTLNNLINTSYVGQSPGLNLEEQSIFQQLYMYNYYSKQARNVVRGIVSASNAGDNILSVSDGDNKIEFVNRNEVGKVYRGLASDAKASLDQLVAKYNIYAAKPVQVGGFESTALSVAANGEFGAEHPTHGQNLLLDAIQQLGEEGIDVLFDGGEDS
jgi:hypothetical protein